MQDGFVKEPAVVTQRNFNASQFSSVQLERIKLEDGIRVHETTKVELETYARQTGKPLVKPFMLVIARDIDHAKSLQSFMESDDFFSGSYKGKVIQVHSTQTGEEKEENVQRLLEVERYDEPTEVVIHVNMLKEGWDVTNLYTIVPLRAANARNLVEQSIGRGLRLPYGKRTGVETVDQLNIIAHDRFQEIVDEANKNDSAIHVKKVFLEGNGSDWIKPKTVISTPNFITRMGLPQNVNTFRPPIEPFYNNPEEQKIANATIQTIKKYEILPSPERLLDNNIQHEIVSDVQSIYIPSNQLNFTDHSAIDIGSIVKNVTHEYVKSTIPIPRIVLIPKHSAGVVFNRFTMDCSSIRNQPVERDLLLKELRTNKERTLSFDRRTITEKRAEDYLVRELIDYDDISYDDHADILYDLSSQLVAHLYTYLSSESDVLNVLQYNQKTLGAFIHSQMIAHQEDSSTEYEVKVTKGFSEIHPSAFTVPENQKEVDAHDTSFDKSQIKSILFTGFSRSLYPIMKFDSDTERRFALFLDSNSEKWFKPALGQIPIYYKEDHIEKMYNPDFVAEFPTQILMVETKAKDEMHADVVLAKKDAAVQWCYHASEYTRKNGGKQWIYLLIPHDEVQDDRSLNYYLQYAT
jgi:type III restriction enzyme